MSTEDAGGSGLPAGISFQLFVPVLLFVAVNRVAGLRWAVIAATAWSLKLLVDRRRKGISLGIVMPVITAAVLVRGAIGAITESESLYFGLGIASKYLVAAVLAASTLVSRPLAALAAPYVLDVSPEIRHHKTFVSTMSIITAIAALYYVVSASFDVWLFRRSGVEGFVVIRFIANWPLSAATLMAIVAVAHRQLGRIPGVDSAASLLERRMTTYWPAQADQPEG